MTIVSKHTHASVKIETNIPVKVYYYSYAKKKFVDANQENGTNGDKAVANIEIKKVVGLLPTEKRPKKLEKLKKGDELVIYKKNYTEGMYKSKVAEVSEYDTTLKTNVKHELILKLVPENKDYKEVIYQVNAQKNKARRNLSIGLNVPFLVLAVPFISADLKANQVQYDLPKKINFTLPQSDNQPVVLPKITDTADDPSKKDNSPFSLYSIKSADKLESLKKEAVERGDYSTAADIKKEQDMRSAEQNKLNTLPQQIDEKVKAEDFTTADQLKKELEALKIKVEKKENLRKEIEAAVAAEEFLKAEKLKADLKALY